MGRRKRPLYAVVAADSRSPRDGRFIEDLGRYAPLQEPASVSLNTDRVLYWLEQGAQPSETVRSILSKEGVMLALHMRRKGASEDDIAQATSAHREAAAARVGAKVKQTAKGRRAEMLAGEEKVAAEREAELAKARAEAEAKAKAEADEARRQAEEERQRAAEEARKQQEAANEAAAEEEAPADAQPAAEAAAETPTEAEPAAEAKEEAPAEAEPAADGDSEEAKAG